jgi:hypothetical protein
LQISMFGLGTLLLISSFTGRYGLAGTVSATGAAGHSPACLSDADESRQPSLKHPAGPTPGPCPDPGPSGQRRHWLAGRHWGSRPR